MHTLWSLYMPVIWKLHGLQASQAGIRHATPDHNESLLNGSKCQKLLTLWSMACSWRVNLAELQNKWPTTNDQPTGTNLLSLSLPHSQSNSQSIIRTFRNTSVSGWNHADVLHLAIYLAGFRCSAVRKLLFTSFEGDFHHNTNMKYGTLWTNSYTNRQLYTDLKNK